LYYFANSPQEISKALDEFAERGALIIEHVFHRGTTSGKRSDIG
jgi:hypothetical protein